MRSPPRPRRLLATSAWTQVFVCTPDKDLAQCVVGRRVVQLDRRRGILRDEDGVVAKWGVRPRVDSGLPGGGRRQRGWFPRTAGVGPESRGAHLLPVPSFRGCSRGTGGTGIRPIRGAQRLSSVLFEQWTDAVLYRQLATLQTRRAGFRLGRRAAMERTAARFRRGCVSDSNPLLYFHARWKRRRTASASLSQRASSCGSRNRANLDVRSCSQRLRSRRAPLTCRTYAMSSKAQSFVVLPARAAETRRIASRSRLYRACVLLAPHFVRKGGYAALAPASGGILPSYG